MSTPETYLPERQRVSILERLVPSVGFAIAAIGGAVGGGMIWRFLDSLRHAENAGFVTVLTGIGEIEVVVGGVLVVAAVLCGIGVLVSAIRMFTTNMTSSPPGVLFLLMALLSVVPAFAIHWALHTMMHALVEPDLASGGLSAVAETVTMLSMFAVGSSVLIVLILIAFSFVPFSSRSGRKVSPLICLLLAEVLIGLLIGFYVKEARTAYTLRDEKQKEDAAQVEEPTFDSTVDEQTIDEVVPDLNSNSNTKMISGGVLNSKAIELPQPVYSPAARAVRASGAVSVQVTINESGEVVEATAASGHPLLRPAAVQAALKAKFNPTKLSGQPVKVTGVITYNFVLQ